MDVSDPILPEKLLCHGGRPHMGPGLRRDDSWAGGIIGCNIATSGFIVAKEIFLAKGLDSPRLKTRKYARPFGRPPLPGSLVACA